MTTLDAQAFVPEYTPTVVAELWQPERRLMLAVLEDALCDCLANAGAPRGIRLARFRQASDWFRSDDTSWPYSFVNICEACGLDAVMIRRRLVRRIRDQVMGESGRPGAGWPAGSWTVGGRTYVRLAGYVDVDDTTSKLPGRHRWVVSTSDNASARV